MMYSIGDIKKVREQLKHADRYYLIDVQHTDNSWKVEMFAKSGKKIVIDNHIFYDIHSVLSSVSRETYRKMINTLSFDEFDYGVFINEEAGIIKIFQKPLELFQAQAAGIPIRL